MFRARLGVRTRILAIALVPSAALLGVGVGTAGYLVSAGNRAEDWAAQMIDGIEPVAELLEAVQDERRATLWIYAGEETDRTALAGARTRLDNAFRTMTPTEDQVRNMGPEALQGDVGDFLKLKENLTTVRAGVDSGLLPITDAYTFYSRLPDVVLIGTRIVQEDSPSAEIAAELAESVQVLLALESLTRANALGAALANDVGLPDELAAEYVRLIGFYRITVQILTGDSDPAQAQVAQNLLASPAWQQLGAMEQALMQRAFPHEHDTTDSRTGAQVEDSILTPLPLTTEEWQAAVAEVSDTLAKLWDDQNLEANSIARQEAHDNARDSLLAGFGVLLLSSSAFVVALLLANRIIRRLKRLRDQTFALADERLPEIMRKLNEGEEVDPAAEAAVLDFGHDEIGQVAKAFTHAHGAAVSAAVTEARTREGVKAVFLNIAHRSQVVVHRQLEILDEAEARQEDPALLETFFRLDHLATRERRNAENLIILAGGQPGRQWRQPVPLIEVVRSGVGEALDYTRVKINRMPEIAVAGTVVADLVHLLAELVDNASSFSPPQSQVEIRGGVVGKGLALEVIDQGMGIPESEQARLNEMLRNPPDFGVNTLSEDSRLGLFVVARLAMRHGISVRLTESDYGGVRAIVLVPTNLTVAAVASGEIPVVARESLAQRVAAVRTESELPRLELESPEFLPPLAPPEQAEPTPAPPAGSATQTGSFEPVAVFEPPTNPTRPPVFPPRPERFPEIGHTARENGRSQYTGSDTRPALPRRRRQASLAPELANAPEAADSSVPSERPAATAEQARDLMSAIENGTRQGRRAGFDAFGPTSTPPDRQEGDGDHLQRW
ncbi:HAMP domain-containing protein [Nocardia otitidiscaviarum]|uniref:histidine kinase n=1 Tax=Nocardia otitidiscaviarum TaxID=1823 RepID=A0A516NKU5_9NOCA|nr:nitrate- and nitrite sensing domain-containing protein [Nocardia otitidiscaviarum]MCP9619032.1 nitrate- and nitrite sensing domain-containing protein [Nocardia otitidiscaviarum]QDP79533.1 HAMP domain-containing protein [Nocardia otitidiscaviarum]